MEGQQLAVFKKINAGRRCYKKEIFYLPLKNEETVDTAIIRQNEVSVEPLLLFRKFILDFVLSYLDIYSFPCRLLVAFGLLEVG